MSFKTLHLNEIFKVFVEFICVFNAIFGFITEELSYEKTKTVFILYHPFI